jgi:hypothetical protein
MRDLIAFCGFAGSGKNSASRQLIAAGYHPIAFADSLKDCLATIFRWDRRALEGNTDESRLWRERIDSWWADKLGIANFTPRWAMTNFGTDIMRRHFAEDVWILNVERKIDEVPGGVPIVLTDVRFTNEVDLVRMKNGRVFRITRGAEPAWVDHAMIANTSGDAVSVRRARRYLDEVAGVHESEWSLIGQPIDGEIKNDGTLGQLHEQVRALCGLNS